MPVEEPPGGCAPTRARVTELRIHGVAGATPGSVLYPGCADQVEFLGDRARDAVGIYRPAERGPDIAWQREAYVWGDLTSGSRSRAFWLLLLPFALANIAFYMTPRRTAGGLEHLAGLRRTVGAGHRLFALSLTGTLIAALAGTSMDVVGWQASGPGQDSTLLGWPGTAVADDAVRRLTLASLPPALLLGLIWWLGSVSWARYDMRTVDGNRPEPPVADVLPADRRMWNGGAPVGRLRSLHVAFGFALIALFLTLPFTPAQPYGALYPAALAVLAVSAVLVALPHAASRPRPGREPAWSSLLGKICAGLRSLALVLYGTAFAAGMFAGGREISLGSRALPGFHGVLETLFWLQAAVLAAVTTGTLVLALGPGDPPEAGTLYPRALRGLAAPVALLMAWTLAAVFAIGLAFTVARIVGTPSFAGDSAGGIVLPGPYWWTTLATLTAVLTVVLLSLWLLADWRRERARLLPEVRRRYPDHAEYVSGNWATAGLTDRTGRVAAVIATVAAASVAAGVILLTVRPGGVPTGPAVVLGIVITAGVAVGLIVVGWRAYEHPALRSTVGVLWDITTFWPRATHPLAPPCYAERVIPDLMDRVRTLVRDERRTVVVSGHSQGSVIAAALVLQLDPGDRRHTRLLTHGSPLRRLYARYFPAYFGFGTLQAVKELFAVPSWPGSGERPCLWSNLHRSSDPVGGPVFAFSHPWAPSGGVDEPLWDPAAPGAERPAPPRRPRDGPETPPRIFGHIDYYLDPAYDDAFHRLIT
ncbi:hypothetical protein ACFFMN_41580 [Planobispora siamensis]|uniref:Integral membrane protein n=1 Tax=Planobispora siamensis TaxID=936338 RepID=A0A8J3SPY7_9ACTN|nr:hypothetical protein [Planobispora siamensis]GIH97229.1 hypothetical protein Psi01_78590 [Planobispora siamensis]